MNDVIVSAFIFAFLGFIVGISLGLVIPNYMTPNQFCNFPELGINNLKVESISQCMDICMDLGGNPSGVYYGGLHFTATCSGLIKVD